MKILNIEINGQSIDFPTQEHVTFELDGVQCLEWLNIGENDEGAFYYVERSNGQISCNYEGPHDEQEILDFLDSQMDTLDVPVLSKINACNDLYKLLDVLNSYDGENLSDDCDLCSLPTFGNTFNEPKNTTEVFSWDDEFVLVDNSGVLEGDDWKLESRCQECGEADFNCKCTTPFAA